MTLSAHMRPYSYMYCATHRDGVLQHVDIDEGSVGSEFLSYEHNIQPFLLERDSQTNYLTFIASNINKHLSGLHFAAPAL